MKVLGAPLQRAMAAAAKLTGKRFGLLVASSLVATSAIVAAAMTGSHGLGPLAGLLGRSLAADHTPALTEPAPEASGPSPGPLAEPGGAGGPEFAPETEIAPEPSSNPADEEAPPAEEELPQAGRIKHVFVVSLASPGYEAAFGAAQQMPYLATTLRPKGDLLSGYSLLSPAALPNSIAAVAGQPPNAQTGADCPTYSEFPAGAPVSKKGVVSGEGCVYPVETLTLADQLGSGRFSWHGYLEGMSDESGKPSNCVHPDPGAADAPPPGGYSAGLNPFVHFHSLLDLGDCASNDLPLTGLAKDLKKVDSTPSYSYISPNLCNAGLSGQCAPGAPDGAAAADAYLAQLVPEILASPAYRRDGLLIVTFGAVNPTAPAEAGAPPAPAPAEPLKVGTLLLSRFITPGSTDAVAYDPYSLLKSTEDLFALDHLAIAGGAKVKSFAPALLGENGGD
jgi:hypothetical protein